MTPTNPDNSPIPEPITYYALAPDDDANTEAEQDALKLGMVKAERDAAKRAVKDLHGWLYAVWMAFLADEETHELNEVLGRLSAFMAERTGLDGPS